MEFNLTTKYHPCGDQPQAIERLSTGLRSAGKFQTLLGVTGSGKTFTMANVIQNYRKPALVISHNKTLAAQLYMEFKEFFPQNAVHYFVSYYDYYQPEAYIPQRDIYIEKDADINEDIDRLRLAATSALMSRSDVIIVSSVSCLYGLGSPEDYIGMVIPLKVNDTVEMQIILQKLVEIQYERNEIEFARGKFRVRGSVIEVIPAYEETGLRIIMDGDKIAGLQQIDPLTGNAINHLQQYTLFPSKHFVMPEGKIERAMESIEKELAGRLKEFRSQGKLLEAQRLEGRTRYDIELLKEVGYCKGIENYSRHLSGREPGQRPFTLIDYFPKDFLMFIDESHVTIPQVHSMYNGDYARKKTLIEYGFRLPSAFDNRPMKFEEWEHSVNKAIFVSATPSKYELEQSKGLIAEQVIRPTGLVDPMITVKPARSDERPGGYPGQVKDLVNEIKKRAARKERVLATTLTKRLAEDLSKYLQEAGVKGRYLHSEIETIERVQIIRDLREGKFDVLVGVNLLREGLDLPEVTLVAILDADKEGFLRSETSIIQTVGRTARNVFGEVILYADKITNSMERAIRETERRRKLQTAFNKKNNITPKTIEKEIKKGIEEEVRANRLAREVIKFSQKEYSRAEMIAELESEMYEAAKKLDFERAARVREEIRKIAGDEGVQKARKGAPKRLHVKW
ncbi:MAG: excinuclease ABC subunit UvrB [Planctomycetes bacterium]|nr:excinuclease ABC subunit UvrB [Planctomycetota bacterium]